MATSPVNAAVTMVVPCMVRDPVPDPLRSAPRWTFKIDTTGREHDNFDKYITIDCATYTYADSCPRVLEHNTYVEVTGALFAEPGKELRLNGFKIQTILEPKETAEPFDVQPSVVVVGTIAEWDVNSRIMVVNTGDFHADVGKVVQYKVAMHFPLTKRFTSPKPTVRSSVVVTGLALGRHNVSNLFGISILNIVYLTGTIGVTDNKAKAIKRTRAPAKPQPKNIVRPDEEEIIPGRPPNGSAALPVPSASSGSSGSVHTSSPVTPGNAGGALLAPVHIRDAEDSGPDEEVPDVMDPSSQGRKSTGKGGVKRARMGPAQK